MEHLMLKRLQHPGLRTHAGYRYLTFNYRFDIIYLLFPMINEMLRENVGSFRQLGNLLQHVY